MKNLLRAFVLLMLAATMTAGGVAHAQAAAKRVVKIDEATGELVDVTEAQDAAKTASAPGIVILNNQKSTQGVSQGSKQTAVQDQAASVIEDSPLNMSAAERRRRDRQNLELQTEQKIVEKLEDARMEDERTRSERLFNKGFSSRDHQPEQQQQVQVVTPPAPVVVVEPKQEPKVDVKSEVRAALTELNAKTEESTTQYYMSGLVGLGDYPDAKNVRGNMAMGFSFGMVTPERFVAEGTFQYSTYDIDTMYSGYQYSTPAFKEMTQYNFQAAAKYQLLSGRVRPVIGAVASYTYRSYEDQQYSYYAGAGNDVSTNAFDLGALAGLDVQISSNFSIGADVRYMKNVAFRESSSYGRSFAYGARAGKSVEEFNYYLGSLVGRFTF